MHNKMSFNVLIGSGAALPAAAGSHQIVLGSAASTVFVGAQTVSAGGIDIGAGVLRAGFSVLDADLAAPAVNSAAVFCSALSWPRIGVQTTVSGETLISTSVGCTSAVVGTLSAPGLSSLTTNTLAAGAIGPVATTLAVTVGGGSRPTPSATRQIR